MKDCKHNFEGIARFVFDIGEDGKPQFDYLKQCTKCKMIDTDPATIDLKRRSKE